MGVPFKRTIICLHTKQSTLSSPLGFFVDFYRKGLLDEAKNNFILQIPDVNDPTDPFAGKVSFVSSDKLEFHLEHSYESYDDDNNVIGLSNLTERIIFSEQLQHLLHLEFVKSVSIIKSKYDSTSLRKRRYEFFNDTLKDKVLDFYDILEHGDTWFAYKDICLKPIQGFVAFFFRQYENYLPSQSSDERIGNILRNYEKGRDVYERTRLTRRTIDVIMNFCDETGSRSFMFDDEQKAIDQFGKLFQSEYKDFKKPLNINGKATKINYLIALLSEYLGFDRTRAQEEKWFTINRTPFIAALCDTEYSRLPKSHRVWVGNLHAAIGNTLD